MTEQIDSCVKFSKSSWHYRMMLYVFGRNYFFYFENAPRDINLCPYCKRVVLGMIMFPFIFAWRQMPSSIRYHEGMAKGIIVWMFISLAVHLTIVYHLKSTSGWWAGTALFFGGLGLLGFVLLFCFLFDKISYKMYLRSRERVRKNKKSNTYFKKSLFSEYLRSTHEKICPCIEFVDEEK